MKLCIIDQIRDKAIDSTQFEPDPRLQGFDKNIVQVGFPPRL